MIKEIIFGITKKLDELYEKMITANTEIKYLRETVKDTTSDYKNLLEKFENKLEKIEKERIMKETELLTKINGLEAKLNALNQEALYYAVKDVAQDVAQEHINKLFMSKGLIANGKVEDPNSKKMRKSLPEANDK